jgi:hypothetical protein
MDRNLLTTNLFKGLRKLWERITGRVSKEPAYQLVPVRVQRRF